MFLGLRSMRERIDGLLCRRPRITGAEDSQLYSFSGVSDPINIRDIRSERGPSAGSQQEPILSLGCTYLSHLRQYSVTLNFSLNLGSSPWDLEPSLVVVTSPKKTPPATEFRPLRHSATRTDQNRENLSESWQLPS